ncbi:MAG: cob(I)yrinic acid a,c-diamide adenosyltransferase [Okeania sp. SIO2C9]|uniref:cob(I)yrinic acid a,c-diamide adenosyltransferase n=1 Tax=Okeania sp. SIO2C9 TaxID=2607791 RepID=UPI0013C0C3A9|nr:cob(I)yrinic acid a,c-diamide adenosyltransferase [Okeania sp. SIO2C9]NEQ78528.1 cob(I)yrinic acid a,c-diamide adenosyltransferase [Okeania sp. SIO2C9]
MTPEQLQKLKAAKDKSHNKREGNEKGLYIVHTGMGKGKTSAAMNMVYRHLAHGRRAAVVQFVKSTDAFESGDRIMLERLSELGMPVSIDVLGGGFTWETQDPQADRQRAQEAFARAVELINDPDVPLVLLDELHIALKHGQLDLAQVVEAISNKPAMCHVITTGRRAPEELIELADLVTDFTKVKHPISAGIPAQIGIEY